MKRIILFSFAGLFSILLLHTSCKKANLEIGVPKPIERKINRIEREKDPKSVVEVWRWKTNLGTYYLFVKNCCDHFNYLYDENCKEVCAPYGGFSGKGDGKCPEFKGEIETTLVWRDN